MSVLIEAEFYDHRGNLVQEYLIPIHHICALRKSDNGCWIHVVGMTANDKPMALRAKMELSDLKALIFEI